MNNISERVKQDYQIMLEGVLKQSEKYTNFKTYIFSRIQTLHFNNYNDSSFIRCRYQFNYLQINQQYYQNQKKRQSKMIYYFKTCYFIIKNKFLRQMGNVCTQKNQQVIDKYIQLKVANEIPYGPFILMKNRFDHTLVALVRKFYGIQQQTLKVIKQIQLIRNIEIKSLVKTFSYQIKTNEYYVILLLEMEYFQTKLQQLIKQKKRKQIRFSQQLIIQFIDHLISALLYFSYTQIFHGALSPQSILYNLQQNRFVISSPVILPILQPSQYYNKNCDEIEGDTHVLGLIILEMMTLCSFGLLQGEKNYKNRRIQQMLEQSSRFYSPKLIYLVQKIIQAQNLQLIVQQLDNLIQGISLCRKSLPKYNPKKQEKNQNKVANYSSILKEHKQREILHKLDQENKKKNRKKIFQQNIIQSQISSNLLSQIMQFQNIWNNWKKSISF